MTDAPLKASYEPELREYERVHARWMDTSRFDVEKHAQVKAELDKARAAYTNAREA